MKRTTRIVTILMVMLLCLLSLPACDGSPASSPTQPTTTPTTSPTASNQPPVISDVFSPEDVLLPENKTTVKCEAIDPDGDTLTYTWSADDGTVSNTTGVADWTEWTAPPYIGEFTVSVVVSDGNGGSDSGSYAISVLDNRPPVIESVTADPDTMLRRETSIVTCIASDPDGDPLSYLWLVDAGSVNGSTDVITWSAPDNDGSYGIEVRVSDERGGTASETITMTVQNPENEIILSLIAAEGGSVDANGGLYAGYRVGDTAENVGQRTYFSFDLSGIPSREITEAKLVFTLKKEVNNPWFIPPFLHVEPVNYGARAIVPGDYDVIERSAASLGKFTSEVPDEFNITYTISQAVLGSKTRYQVMMRMESGTNNNSKLDYLEFEKAEIFITFVE